VIGHVNTTEGFVDSHAHRGPELAGTHSEAAPHIDGYTLGIEFLNTAGAGLADVDRPLGVDRNAGRLA